MSLNTSHPTIIEEGGFTSLYLMREGPGKIACRSRQPDGNEWIYFTCDDTRTADEPDPRIEISQETLSLLMTSDKLRVDIWNAYWGGYCKGQRIVVEQMAAQVARSVAYWR